MRYKVQVMFIVTLKHLADFSKMFSELRQADYIFYEVREDHESSRKTVHISFLGTLGSLSVVFQIIKNLPSTGNLDSYLTSVRDEMDVDGITMVEGIFREVYLSIS
ncbi:hypothetical protein GF325_17135 [Candidatus Bathyarchaeota archaeon]|nr:hypothetical protein [Candidatus Bathyarchaeota archaeon]